MQRSSGGNLTLAASEGQGPGVVMFWPFVFIFIIVVVILGLVLASVKISLAETKTKLGITQSNLVSARAAETAAKRQLENLLVSPISVEVIYDPTETVSQPANPTSSDSIRLVWNLGLLGGAVPAVAGTKVEAVVLPLRLMNYTAVYSNGSRIIGEEPSVLLEAIIHATNQRMELLSAVDGETGFIDQ